MSTSNNITCIFDVLNTGIAPLTDTTPNSSLRHLLAHQYGTNISLFFFAEYKEYSPEYEKWNCPFTCVAVSLMFNHSPTKMVALPATMVDAWLFWAQRSTHAIWQSPPFKSDIWPSIWLKRSIIHFWNHSRVHLWLRPTGLNNKEVAIKGNMRRGCGEEKSKGPQVSTAR